MEMLAQSPSLGGSTGNGDGVRCCLTSLNHFRDVYEPYFFGGDRAAENWGDDPDELVEAVLRQVRHADETFEFEGPRPSERMPEEMVFVVSEEGLPLRAICFLDGARAAVLNCLTGRSRICEIGQASSLLPDH